MRMLRGICAQVYENTYQSNNYPARIWPEAMTVQKASIFVDVDGERKSTYLSAALSKIEYNYSFESKLPEDGDDADWLAELVPEGYHHVEFAFSCADGNVNYDDGVREVRGLRFPQIILTDCPTTPGCHAWIEHDYAYVNYSLSEEIHACVVDWYRLCGQDSAMTFQRPYSAAVPNFDDDED